MTCKACDRRRELNRKLVLKKHLARKARFHALQKALQDGKVVRLWYKDEITGYHYRQDKRGNIHYGGIT